MSAGPLFRPELIVVRLIIESFDAAKQRVPPRTKKNSPQIIPHMKRPILAPSANYRIWHSGARRYLYPRLLGLASENDGLFPISFQVNMEAIFYRDANRGDLFGFLDGLADFLQDDLRPPSKRADGPKLSVLENDVLIQSVDGSRLRKDKERPRIEVVLTELR